MYGVFRGRVVIAPRHGEQADQRPPGKGACPSWKVYPPPGAVHDVPAGVCYFTRMQKFPLEGLDFEALVAPAFDDGNALHLAFFRRKLMLQASAVPTVHPETLGLTPVRSQCVGRLGKTHVFSHELRAAPEGIPGVTLHDLRELFGRLSEAELALAGRAVQVVEWDRQHQFCGACATPTVRSTEGRSRTCPACKLTQFPRVAPAIMVAIERGDEILLARGPHFPKGIHSVLAGFVDPGESAEEAVAREVKEEVGLRVRNVRYFGSQPWPFPNSLMLAFQAHYHDGEITPEPGEIEEAAFYRFDNLPGMFTGGFSISQWLIADFLRRHGRA